MIHKQKKIFSRNNRAASYSSLSSQRRTLRRITDFYCNHSHETSPFSATKPNFPDTKVKVPKHTRGNIPKTHVGNARLLCLRGVFVVSALTRLNITLRAISWRNSRHYLRRLINSATTLYPHYVLALGKRSSPLPRFRG